MSSIKWNMQGRRTTFVFLSDNLNSIGSALNANRLYTKMLGLPITLPKPLSFSLSLSFTLKSLSSNDQISMLITSTFLKFYLFMIFALYVFASINQNCVYVSVSENFKKMFIFFIFYNFIYFQFH